MTNSELGFCLSSVVCSSASQLFIKSASASKKRIDILMLLGAGGGLQLGSVLLVVLALRTIQLSQLIPFAAVAYLLVPIGSYFVFKERFLPRLWLGALFIIIGIILMH
uniref:Undecaprenyl phosphate-alpha-L-ara4N flippase subunit ArnE n=1 Tax=Candidatus Kentrum sp. LPFa TaxID=2126335 RepID=A0A450VT85_9GAMM|nr:MAG: undecaprenyl phosphate-alpha-L-ara4N flippase subunit ArnE [Candidatus Kentron sp. LPFa]VFK25767.1 MAG: undecaprenyl phosphate-alpha-L-ara4N flippase subunit ArnE [Candidatus Kentron sp. LPFa]